MPGALVALQLQAFHHRCLPSSNHSESAQQPPHVCYAPAETVCCLQHSSAPRAVLFASDGPSDIALACV